MVSTLSDIQTWGELKKVYLSTCVGAACDLPDTWVPGRLLGVPWLTWSCAPSRGLGGDLCAGLVPGGSRLCPGAHAYGRLLAGVCGETPRH